MQQQPAPPPKGNLLLFVLLLAALGLAYMQFRHLIFPAAPKADPVAGPAGGEAIVRPTGSARLPAPPTVTPDSELITLGEGDGFDLRVRLDPLGGGVRSLLLTQFRPALPSGQPGPRDEELELIPDEANRLEPAFALTHYEAKDFSDHPVDTLARRRWEVVKKDGKSIVTEEVEGKKQHAVTFATEVEGVRISKTYTLTAGEFHLGLMVTLSRPKPASTIREADRQGQRFRYQLAGAKGLPIEGKWYTSIFRNALIALEDDRGYIYRDLQEMRAISLGLGGNPVPKTQERFLRYAGVAVQYFASVIVVDENQKDQTFLRSARPTLERGVVKGKLKPGTADLSDRVVLLSEDGKNESVIYLPPLPGGTAVREQYRDLREGVPIAVVYRHASYSDRLKESPRIAEEIHVGRDAEATHALWVDDITVRVSTEELTLAPGASVTHKYLLYNGPVKPSLLGSLASDRLVNQELVARYVDKLNLNTMTDYHSPGAMGTFSSSIGWTYVIVKCTNFMHWVLGKITTIVPSYGLSIILLTLMVRGLMFPLSRKQAIMGLKMAALQPQLKALQEKHKDDKQAFAAEQMRVFRENGVNPFGSCWVILLQMPIFMGLYFSLQESIQFRLAPFWPTWIDNLAAPDMLLEWGRNIPLLSRDADYGGLIYLGPYFNLLPLFAVAFMVVQQKLMTPPPTNKEQEMQQKMMRFMMIFFGLFFYKMAAGLCIYIITSTVWGFTERKLLPKPKKPVVGTAPPTNEATAIALGAKSEALTTTAGRKAGKNRKKGGIGGRPVVKEEVPATGLGRLRQRLGAWWSDVLEQAKKK